MNQNIITIGMPRNGVLEDADSDRNASLLIIYPSPFWGFLCGHIAEAETLAATKRHTADEE
jgi:hypothetical protein